MNDRELVEMAARAIGCVNADVAKRRGTELVTHETATGPFWMIDGNHRYHWNPLTHDSDAFQLAVKLKLQVLTGQGPNGDITWVRPPEELDLEGPSERHGSDACAATRRAIVRAAALMAN